jgi:carboxyl-terminal processing protease
VDNGSVPYIDIETFLMMVEGALDSDILVFDYNEDVLVISYSVEYEDFDGTMVEEELFMTIDFTANTVTVDSFSFFSYYITSTETDFGEGLIYVDAEYREPQTVVIDLNHYRFDLVIDTTDDVYLMPLHVANLIFLGRAYYDVYYNGDKLIGFDTFSRNNQEIISQLRSSSLNGVNPSRDLRESTYHFLALAFDYFYGLRNDRGVETYYNFLSQYADDIIMRTNATLYNTLFEISNKLDDLHTSHGFPGYHASSSLNPTVTQLSQLGPRVQQWYQGLWSMQDKLAAQHGSHTNLPTVRYIDQDRTAIIYITGFTVDTPGEFKRTMDNLPASVQNVVIDLTYNTGGNLGAVLRIFGYMTDQGIQYHSQNPARWISSHLLHRK